jgi:hypothetical protein
MHAIINNSCKLGRSVMTLMTHSTARLPNTRASTAEPPLHDDIAPAHLRELIHTAPSFHPAHRNQHLLQSPLTFPCMNTPSPKHSTHCTSTRVVGVDFEAYVTEDYFKIREDQPLDTWLDLMFWSDVVRRRATLLMLKSLPAAKASREKCEWILAHIPKNRSYCEKLMEEKRRRCCRQM